MRGWLEAGNKESLINQGVIRGKACVRVRVCANKGASLYMLMRPLKGLPSKFRNEQTAKHESGGSDAVIISLHFLPNFNFHSGRG